MSNLSRIVMWVFLEIIWIEVEHGMEWFYMSWCTLSNEHTGWRLCNTATSNVIINESRKDMNMLYCKTSEIYIIREMHATQLHLSICFRYILDLNLVRIFFVTGTSWEIFLCCEANGRDVDKYQCRQIHKIQGHAIGCISSKHVSVFFSCKTTIQLWRYQIHDLAWME